MRLLWGTSWNLVWSNPDHSELTVSIEHNCPVTLKIEIDDFAIILKDLISVDDQQLCEGVWQFLKHFKVLAGYRSTARLSSVFHQSGTDYRGSVSRTILKGVCHGKRVPVRSTATGRRCDKTSRGKSRVLAGRICKSLSSHSEFHNLPERKEPKGKHPHSLSLSISKGLQNAGKW